MTGIAIIKMNFALKDLENPKNLAAVNVIPDLLTPGIKANACPSPIKNPRLIVIYLEFENAVELLSDI